MKTGQLEKFVQLNKVGDKLKTAEYLIELLPELKNDEDICWARWNISDNYAMLRMGEKELENHIKFEKQLSKMESKYLPWIVSDATQKFELKRCGFGEYWTRLYKASVMNTPRTPENIRIRFESHRAAAAASQIIDTDERLFAEGIKNMREVLAEMDGSDDADFYRLIYYAILLNRSCITTESRDEAVSESLPLFYSLAKTEIVGGEKPVIGSWQGLNWKRTPENYVNVGTTNYIHALINCGKFKEALECDKAVRKLGFKRNNYYLKRMKYAAENI